MNVLLRAISVASWMMAAWLPATRTAAQAFTWSASPPPPPGIEAPPDVVFINGAVLQRVTDASAGQQELRVVGARQQKAVVARNAITTVEAVWPARRRAVAAVIAERCLAPSCAGAKLQLLVPERDGVRRYPIGDAKTVHLSIRKRRVVGGTAEAVNVGLNAQGAEIREARVFVPGSGFVHPGVHRRWLRYLGAHPYDLLDSVDLRPLLVQHLGRERYRRLRATMNVASRPEILAGRYLVFEGCLAHHCDEHWAAVVLDGLTDDTWWALSESGVISSGSVLSNASSIDWFKLRGYLTDAGTSDYHFLTFGPLGELTWVLK